MTDFAILIQIMEISVQRNGADKPMTLGHFLNILKMVNRRQEAADFNLQKSLDEIFNDQHRYGNDSD